MKKISLVVATIAAAVMVSAASAATLGFTGGSSQALPGNFGSLRDIDGVVGTPVDLSGPIAVFGGSASAGDGLVIDGSGSVRVTVTYVGYEAGNTNFGGSFAALDGFSNAFSSTGDAYSFIQGAGSILDIAFASLGQYTSPCLVLNGATAGSSCQIGFSSIFNSGKSTFALFGDGLGDNDFDDLVVRIDVSPVPVPASGLLLVGALGGAWAMRKMRRT